MKYNKEKADELAEEFIAKTGVDVFSTTRKAEQVFLRTLFYKVLVNYNEMIDQNIEDWYKEHGVSKNRSSIYIALKKIDMYYKLNDTFRDIYDIYFNNKIKERIALEKAKMKTPRSGSVAKACTDVSTPLRTIKVPSKLRENAAIASNTVHDLNTPRFSVTLKECSNAVATNHGMSDAFSTGSQNHQPPQPSSE